jgi:fluoride exporter
MNLIWIMIGGSLGALLRYGTTLFCVRIFGASFPMGTLVVNLSGCFLIGLIMGLAEAGPFFTPSFRLFFVTGFLGALTTFSSYAWESIMAIRGASLGAAVLNILLNNLAGFGLVLAGIWLAKH